MTEFTPPRDWATGNLVAATDLNTHLRDNMKALHEMITAQQGEIDELRAHITNLYRILGISGSGI